jgi:hypothetical protein
MKRAILILALCSSCTFTHVALNHDTQPAPTVQLSPGMAKLDRQQQSSPLWAAGGDIALVMGGFMAGPATENETANLAGFAVSALTMASLAVTLALWGHL